MFAERNDFPFPAFRSATRSLHPLMISSTGVFFFSSCKEPAHGDSVIRNYTESMFFGLSLRQFVFSLLAVGVAVLLYFVLKPYVGTETVSWMCILGAAPFAAMGFVNYNGMTAEQFVWAWLRSEMLEPKQIKFEPVNIYYEALKDAIDERKKEVSKHND